VIERSICVTTHGRYIVDEPGDDPPVGLLVGFHGYAEPAEAQLDRLRSVPAGGWLRASVQGLHRFYRGRSRDVVASWMTRQDRELAIADNAAYVAAVVDEIAQEWAVARVVYAGFSQGVAMAFRAAAQTSRRADVVALGGDVPPELDAHALAGIPAVLVGRGHADEFYGADAMAADVERLRAARVGVEAVTIDGGHEWTAQFSGIVARYLGAST